MYRQIKNQIKNNILPKPDNHILVATSGGADSMVLLSLLHKVGYKLTAAHCNFNLRPRDCDLDQFLVESFCNMLRIKCYTKSFETINYAKTHKISIEMAARDLRYNWFKQLKADIYANYIATGHHLNDNIETVLLNLIRGTGLRGLVAMTPWQSDIIRPLLFADKKHIIKYAVANNIPFREDYTNNDNSITRNLLRNIVIPEFEKINPSFVETMRKNMDILSSWHQFSTKQLQQVSSNIVKKSHKGILIKIDSETDKATQKLVLFELLSDIGYSGNRIYDYLKIIDSQIGVSINSGEHIIIRERTGVLIANLELFNDFDNISIESIPFYGNQKVGVTIEFSDTNLSNDYLNNRHVECIDYESIKLPLTVRKWQKGDRFFPLGMSGSKKVSDFLTDIKIKSAEKRRQLVLTDQKGIVWVIGQRLDKRYATTGQTKKYLLLKCD